MPSQQGCTKSSPFPSQLTATMTRWYTCLGVSFSWYPFQLQGSCRGIPVIPCPPCTPPRSLCYLASTFSHSCCVRPRLLGKSPRPVTNSYMELVVILLHHNCMACFFDIFEYTTLAHTETMDGVRWHLKGFPTCTSPPAHLLCLQSIHQCHHHYISLPDFISGINNSISYLPSSSNHLFKNQPMSHFNHSYPHNWE